MTNWLLPKSALVRPRYRSLTKLIETAIEDGVLKPGERLPTHRELSYQLGLSVQTVSRAYSRLVETGHIVGEVGRGSFVRSAKSALPLPFPAQRAGRGTLDMALLKPLTGDLHRRAMQDALRGIARKMPDEILTSFRPSTIANQYPEIIDRWLSCCGVKCDGQSVIPTNGNTSAMTVALLSVAHSGDLIVTESMGQHTLPALCRSLGLRLRGLEVDDQGLVPDALEAACRTDTVKALYTLPRSGPMGRSMGPERRKAIVAIARRHNLSIIENDAWGALAPSTPPPLATLAPERCLYFTSLTKCLAPGLRVGFLVVPDAMAATVEERHIVTNWMVAPLMFEIAAQWIDDGTAEHLLTWQRAAMRGNGRMAAEVLGSQGVRVAPTGSVAWLPCRDARSEARLVEETRTAGVLVSPGATFAIGPLESHPGVRMSLGVNGTDTLRHGLHIIAMNAAGRQPEAGAAI